MKIKKFIIEVAIPSDAEEMSAADLTESIRECVSEYCAYEVTEIEDEK